MSKAITVSTAGRSCRVDALDVAAWSGLACDVLSDEDAIAYVHAHPRPSHGAAQGQRIELLRRLASGPSTDADLRAALRRVGWVGADDLENRLREVRTDPSGRGAGAHGVSLVVDQGRYRLGAPLPHLSPAQQHALGFAKAMVAQLDGALARAAVDVLEQTFPGIAPAPQHPPAPPASTAALETVHTALVQRRPIRLRYASANTRTVRDYDLVPMAYATTAGTVKAICAGIDANAQRVAGDRQFALDRIQSADLLNEWNPARFADFEPERTTLRLVVADGLLAVLQARDVFGMSLSRAREAADDHRAYEVEGTFLHALSWDVMEQLCGWAGSVQVLEPLWLVNAVCRRLRAGLREMESAAGFELVKPEPGKTFSSHGQAVHWEPHGGLEQQQTATKLPPRR